MTILKIGDSGPDVKKWQYFLIGQGLLTGKADGEFGPLTKSASIEFQKQHGLQPDGIVGNKTFGAAMLLGYGVVADTRKGIEGPNWPPKPNFKPLTSNAERAKVFGQFRYEADPVPGNPEHIRLLDNWAQNNITMVDIPQLKPVKGSARVQFHKAAANQLIKLWSDWQKANLLHLIYTWGGSYNPRFVRGSRTTLSNHAYGSAFDINMAWNPLGAVPALAGQKGSVRELVGIANDNGFYWGGHFTRLDGMHFEVAVVG